MTHYEKYRPSGVEWIDKIPSHWKVKRLKYEALAQPSNVDKKTNEGEELVLLCNYMDVYKNEFIDSSLKFMEATASQDEISKFSIKKGDVLITKDSETTDDIANPALVNQDLQNVVCGYHLTQIRPTRINLLGEYLFRLFQENRFKAQFEVAANGVTRYGLSTDVFTDAFVPLPTLEEQRAIAKYLDKKTALIDELIAKKQRLIELLKEERTAVINEAVSGKGKNWERKKLKYIIKDFESGVSVNSADEPVSFETEIGILKTSCVYNYVFEPSKNKRVLTEEVVRVSCPVKSNSLIISRMNTPDLVGASGFVDRDYPNLFLPDRLWQTILHKHVHLSVKYLGYVFISNFFRQEMTSKATGTSSSMKNLSKDDVLEITVPIPCYDDQISILKLIEAETQKIDTTNSKIEKEINLMQEYRTALISEVVTGKIKIG